MEKGPNNFDFARLKRDIIENTGPGKRFSRRGLSLAASEGKSPDIVRDFIIRGKDRKPNFDTIVGLVHALGNHMGEYMIMGPAPVRGPEKIEVIGTVQAGVWREQGEWPVEDRYTIEVDPSPYAEAERFALEVVGHSMERTIPNGSIITCLRVGSADGLRPLDGDIVVVERQRNGLFETTCKRLVYLPDGHGELRAESNRPEFAEPIAIERLPDGTFTDDEIRVVAIVEKAIQQHFRRR